MLHNIFVENVTKCFQDSLMNRKFKRIVFELLIMFIEYYIPLNFRCFLLFCNSTVWHLPHRFESYPTLDLNFTLYPGSFSSILCVSLLPLFFSHYLIVFSIGCVFLFSSLFPLRRRRPLSPAPSPVSLSLSFTFPSVVSPQVDSLSCFLLGLHISAEQ